MTADTAPETSHERYAALDLGSNSFHLLLAEFRDQRMVRLHTDRAMVRLAEGLDSERNLAPEVAERALEALRRFAPVIQDLPLDNVRVVGTNTLRAASTHADGFLEAAEAILGAPIEIISGIEEARLIYSGVMAAAEGTPSLRCVVDIGGGSTELVRGVEKPRLLQSINMGCVAFNRRFFESGKIDASKHNNFVRARRAAQAELQELQHMADDALVMGASGTVKSVARVLNDGELLPIQRDDLEKLAGRVAACKTVEAIDLPHLNPQRRPVFAAGLAILHGIFRELDIQQMHISPYAIREGIVHDLAGRAAGGDRRADTVTNLMERGEIDPDQAKRVANTALQFLGQLNPHSLVAQRRLLHWAADLHELGLILSHSSFRKLGAYMIEHADMAGFSKSEQENLAYLVRNQRGDIKVIQEHYGFHPGNELLLCLRLACIVHRDHVDRSIDSLQLSADGPGFRLEVPERWLHENPAIEDLLALEVECWEDKNIKLTLKQT
ncbi:Ppx/GppA phosphatase family protein [Microbulbifer hydrolyticus]|uniref:Exopolyphosphatase/guanosine-5'-triphosphate, 3'-diphosphate pyrophosphatase n=1 Tax=Microbulbifer hydrolyticus TaxID=48074 RepID=A0A6P1TE85_9GAMM|nr:Ppx/GppA phosphatase family protein [Microbulbifer hydrolyticus]MBB5212529.1 exopolyphosphatase/guanosine-5'-triphosphate,3'-diphosphate pyrophosphatase [Microbulbifer hydrolyticus]QHQ40151.1 Ppx/GppA family phosphatase [Microbulbifer hydrolyticus]